MGLGISGFEAMSTDEDEEAMSTDEDEEELSKTMTLRVHVCNCCHQVCYSTRSRSPPYLCERCERKLCDCCCDIGWSFLLRRFS
jgi:hypothetical protein